MKYWAEGLLAREFDSIKLLPSLSGGPSDLGDSTDKIEANLLNYKFDPRIFEESEHVVRHLILKLRNKTDPKKNWVVSVLPIQIIEDYSAPEGFGFIPHFEPVPLFNRDLIGEEAKLPGLMLDNVDDFNDWAASQSRPEEELFENMSASENLELCLSFWDGAFNQMGYPGKGGLAGWITRFRKNRRDHSLIKNLDPVICLVDCNAALIASFHVKKVLGHFIQNPSDLSPPELSLLRRISGRDEPEKQVYKDDEQRQELDHLSTYFGHMDSFRDGKHTSYSLDQSQRDALIAFVKTPEGELLAVNGPPGTGKTSFLRAVIASHWIEPLLRKDDRPQCPFILATAATNQAVTNIISSFDEVPASPVFDPEGGVITEAQVGFRNRWLPHLSSYGWYAPSQLKGKASQKFGSYQLIHRARETDSWEFAGRAEAFGSVSPTQKKAAYLSCSAKYFGSELDLASTLDRLQQEVIFEKEKLMELKVRVREWLEVVELSIHQKPWTQELSDKCNSLEFQIEALSGPFSRLEQTRKVLFGIEKELSILNYFAEPEDPVHQYQRLFQSSGPVSPLKQPETFQSLIRKRESAIKLADYLERKSREGTVEKIVNFGRNLFLKREFEQTPATALKTLEILGVRVPDGKPDFLEWRKSLTVRLSEIESEVLACALQEIHTFLVEFGFDISPPNTVFPSVWRTQLQAHQRVLSEKHQAVTKDIALEEYRLGLIVQEFSPYEKHRLEYLKTLDQLTSANEKLFKVLASIVDVLPDDLPLLSRINRVQSDFAKGLISAIDPARIRVDVIRETQDFLDQTVRPKMFHLAARYWEGRYVEKELGGPEETNGEWISRPGAEESLRDLAMLAPVFVSTAFSAPKLMRANEFDQGRLNFPYLAGKADFLIMDEAGQATPEIGVSAFSFARKAIVVGDTEQLEPVWGITQGNDIGLARRFGLIRGNTPDVASDFTNFSQSGFSLSNGSLMRMAQRATYWSNPAFPETPGLTLTNHYRCLTPIIEICNRMVYRGRLNPVTPVPQRLWRPELKRLGFLVVEQTVDTKIPGGSRKNRSEAESIAHWIAENEEHLVRHFGKGGNAKIEDILAIITPYKGQIRELKAALAKRYGLPLDENSSDFFYNRLTIDTVHSLQGAERQVVIFSMVETNDPTMPQFYDKGSNLLNVAISRAKEMFIVALTQNAIDYGRKLTNETLRKPSDHLWHALATEGSRLNSRRVIIVESSKKAPRIHEALGNSIEVEILFTNGHFTELADTAEWDILTSPKPVWTPLSTDGEKLFFRLERLWGDIEELFLATDSDPEGEAIAWHVLRILGERKREGAFPVRKTGSPRIRRMRFYNLSPTEILRSVDDAGEGLDAGLVKSSLVRKCIDEIINTLYPKRIGLAESTGHCRGIGRVQLGILDLVQRCASQGEGYEVRVSIPLKNGNSLQLMALAPTATASGSDEAGIWSSTSKPQAQEASERIRLRLQKGSPKVEMSWSADPLHQLDVYPGLNTARFLALAWRARGLKPWDVMKTLQELYEKGPETGRNGLKAGGHQREAKS